MVAEPWSGGVTVWADAVIATAVVLVFCGIQVPDQRPSPRLERLIGSSPVENETITNPDVIKLPQSSTTVTSTDEGQAAEVVKLWPSEVNSGSSLVGVHPAAAGSPPASLDNTDEIDPGEGRTIRRIAMRCEV